MSEHVCEECGQRLFPNNPDERCKCCEIRYRRMEEIKKDFKEIWKTFYGPDCEDWPAEVIIKDIDEDAITYIWKSHHNGTHIAFPRNHGAKTMVSYCINHILKKKNPSKCDISLLARLQYLSDTW